MRNLTNTEIEIISGAKIEPSTWVWGAALGTTFGTFCAAISGGTIGVAYGLGVGMGLGTAFFALNDVMYEYEKSAYYNV